MSVPYFSNTDFHQDEQTCRECFSSALSTDVAQGDVICTDCGVVAQSHNPYLGAEWRDFDTADDLAKGQASSARCGGVLVDESKYYGGLEPTMMSSSVFGGQYGHGSSERAAKEAKIRQNLLKTHKVVEVLMEKRWKKQIEKKQFLADARKRKREEWGIGQDEEETEIEGADQIQDPLSMVPERWSLHRALLLHGRSDEIPSQYRDADSEREYLRGQMDASQRKASLDVYRANTSINGALLKLNLAETRKVFNDIMEMVCQYAAKKKGFTVRGVSTRVVKLEKKALEQQKECNKERQIAAVGSAFIYFICKKQRLGRSLTEICASFQVTNRNYPLSSKEDLIKPTHCSKAMNEIKLLFPDFVQSVTLSASDHSTKSSVSSSVAQKTSNRLHSNEISSTTNLIEHTMQKLNLPLTAVNAITALVLYCRQQQLASGHGSGTTKNTLIASVTVLVCGAGEKMQKLATDSIRSGKRKQIGQIRLRKRIKLENGISPKPSFVSSMTAVNTDDDSSTKTMPTSVAKVISMDTDTLLSSSPIPITNDGRSYWYEWSREKTW
eukprot:CAMPEP_0198255802 /NCGR_PEP_ID=MMETSP1447-20131203/5853_1 /TAXON_ID=420782 /ORGANISM="Chaetoceros dichaeta, Strain CCMP1751" /LENGTH=553 /DNA_ID=CAMNT_0043942277 /DNA_START=104 /DNA_END=1762 /DNA_ORIENTATION=+